MRRLLVISALAALPLLASAQVVTAPAGQLQGKVNNQIGAQQCLGQTTLDVRWTMLARPPASTVGGLGTVKIFASDQLRSSTGTNDPRTCFIPGDSSTTTPAPKTIQVVEVDSQQVLQNELTITGAQVQAMATTLGLDCNAQTSGTPIYMCALAYPNSGTANPSYTGYANGTFTLNTRKPDKPTNVATEPADGALRVRWTEATTGETATEFRVEAITADPRDSTPNVAHTARTNSSPVMVGGLTNHVEYTVTVIAISNSGTESDPSDAATGTPLPTADFWEWYHDQRGGVEQGGCATGAAGVLAMLGAAALLRVRRRKP